MLEYLTPEEVAEKLRVSQRTVYEWLRNGRLRGLQVGRWWRIRPADLEEFFAVGLLLKALAEMHRAEPDRPAFHYSLIQDHLSLKGHRFEEKALKEALQQAEARGLVSPKPGGDRPCLDSRGGGVRLNCSRLANNRGKKRSPRPGEGQGMTAEAWTNKLYCGDIIRWPIAQGSRS